MRITVDLLVTLDACAPHRAAFAAAFPDGLHVTGEPDAYVIASVVEATLDVDWLCVRALTETAFSAYREAMTPALAAYDKVVTPALAAYREAMTPTLAAYDKVVTPALAAYDRVMATAAWRLLANPDNIIPEYRR